MRGGGTETVATAATATLVVVVVRVSAMLAERMVLLVLDLMRSAVEAAP